MRRRHSCGVDGEREKRRPVLSRSTIIGCAACGAPFAHRPAAHLTKDPRMTDPNDELPSWGWIGVFVAWIIFLAGFITMIVQYFLRNP